MRKVIATIVFLVSVATVVAQGVLPAGWVRWTNKQQTISLGHPREWQQWDFKMGEIVSFVTPKDNPKDAFPDGLVLISRPNNGNLTLDQLSASGNKAMSRSGAVKVVSSRKLTLGKRVCYRNELAAADGKWAQLAYVFIHKGAVYFLQLTVEPRNKQALFTMGDDLFRSLTIK